MKLKREKQQEQNNKSRCWNPARSQQRQCNLKSLREQLEARMGNSSPREQHLEGAFDHTHHDRCRPCRLCTVVLLLMLGMAAHLYFGVNITISPSAAPKAPSRSSGHAGDCSRR